MTTQVVADVLALWVVHTWAFDACWATPYLRVISAAPGQRQVAAAGGAGVDLPPRVAGGQPKPGDPLPEDRPRQPTLFLDEMDNFALDEKRDALAVLNSGYKPGVAVPRCNERGELEEFAASARRPTRASTSGSSCRHCSAARSRSGWRPSGAGDGSRCGSRRTSEPRAAELRARCAAWAERHTRRVKGHRPDLVGLVNRQAEVWWILLSLGELAGGEWTERARAAARVLGAGGDETDRPSQQVQLLMDIDAAFGNDTTIFTRTCSCT